MRSIYSGLDYICDGWHLTDPMELFDKGGLEAIHQHFREGRQEIRQRSNDLGVYRIDDRSRIVGMGRLE